jgi:hypothetical protein
MLVSLVANWRYIAWGLAVAAVMIFTLQVSHWRSRAAAADVAEAQLRRTMAELIQYQVDLLAADKKLKEKKIEVVVKTNDVIKHVVKYIKDSPDCTFSADAIRVLNDAKRVSPAAPGAFDGSPAPNAGSGN